MAYLTKLVLDFLSKLMEKTEGGTYDRSTDSNEAISEAIAGLGGGGLSDKEKSLIGIGTFPGLQDYFNKVANDAYPDSTYWNVIENGGTVNVEIDTGDEQGYVNCYSNTITGNDAIITTRDKFIISLKNGVTTIHLKGRVKFNWAAENGDQNGFGFVTNQSDILNMQFLRTTSYYPISILVRNQVITAYASDNTSVESADLSSWISDNTWFTIEIVVSNSDAKFYIDGTLRATLNTYVPNISFQVAMGATCVVNTGINSYFEYVQIWAE